ncbi:MAG: 3-deoxy-manno-octulosonate cytidylyltransferase [Xanthomonadales bacterium]|nr:3-deoxy-manno-octulosonate cytidylyltransferase [Xanthomonadales bacterium]
MERFFVIIPARYASERFPGKVIAPVAGRPLIQHAYEAARGSGAEQVWVATDDDRVAQVCDEFDASSIMTGRHNSGSDRIAEAAAQLKLPDDAIIVNLQGDEPLTPPAAIRQAAEAIANNPDAQVATLCAPIRSAEALHDPNVVKVVTDSNRRALYFSRAPIPYHRDYFSQNRAELPPDTEYLRHIGIYAYRNGFLQHFCSQTPCASERSEKLEQLRALDMGARIVVARCREGIPQGVDVPEDVARVEALLREQPDQIRVLFVCMGNICRSPTAQGVAEAMALEGALRNRFEFDSAGTHAYHVGEPPDPRSQRAARRRGIDLSRQRARRVSSADFMAFDYIIAMDERNYQALRELQPDTPRARLHKMLEFSSLDVAEDVPDPYPGGEHGFEQVLDLLENAIQGLFTHLEKGES